MRTLTQQDKFRIAHRDDFTCQFCGDAPGNSDIEIEHLIPVSKFGSDNPENLVASCRKCNRNKSDLVMFPKAMIEGPCELDKSWSVHRSFGRWQIKIHPTDGSVLEYTPYGYWIDGKRAHQEDWEHHILKKGWPPPHTKQDFLNGLRFFRRMVVARAE